MLREHEFRIPDDICLTEAVDPVEGNNWERIREESMRRMRVIEKRQQQMREEITRRLKKSKK